MSKQVNYIDLCSGIGGFRVALNNISKKNNILFNCLLSADIKQDAIDTYNLNFNETNKKTDIYTLEPEQIPGFDLLCAGFPCQPFSSAGQKKGFSDERGGMIFKIIEICKYHKPENVLLENVYNLIKLNNGECIKEIKKLFEEIGYFVSYTKLNSKDFGCPQSRERVYIICNKNKLIDFKDIKYKPEVLLKDIINYDENNSTIDPKFINRILNIHSTKKLYGYKLGDKRGGKYNIHSWDIEYTGVISDEEKTLMNSIMLERRKKHWAVSKKIKWMDGMPLTLDEIKTFCSNEKLEEMLKNLVRYNYLKIEKPKDIIDNKRVYQENGLDGYNICKGKLSFPISKILDPNGLSPTLTATDACKLSVITDKTLRNLTKNEIKLICGFPRDFKIPDGVNYFDLFGNMATPPVLESLFELIY